MADRKVKAAGAAGSPADSHHGINGHGSSKSPAPLTNGIGRSHANIGEEPTTGMNGNIHAQNAKDVAASQVPRMAQLPEELLELFKSTFPDDIYTPISQLVERATQMCWADLVRLMQTLKDMKLREARDVTDRMRGEPQTPNDTSQENRLKKRMLWDYAESHKQILIKLLVILQWSAKTEANQATIALNWYLNQLRSYFAFANGALGEQLRQTHMSQDPAPNLETAAEILAIGRKADLPDLGYREERKLSNRQILRTLRRLNRILIVRMNTEEKEVLPPALSIWRVHDGRVTFTVADEFDVSFSVLSEEPDAKFLTVDVYFNFRPKPNIPQYLLDEILATTNNQLAEKGVDGAYKYLHDLTLTQKIEEFAQQASTLNRAAWISHLEIESHRRTLVVRYWSQRPGPKSWVEFVIMSGRRDASGNIAERPIPYIQLRWMRDGKHIADHDVQLNLRHISFENVITQVIAQHINFIFDGIYEKLDNLELFTEGGLELEQTSSHLDGHDCQLSIELSKSERLSLQCDVVSGSVLISPPSQRAFAFQADLSSSKDLVADFPSRFQRFRCGSVQQTLVNAVKSAETLWPVARRINSQQMTDMFGPTTLRVSYMKHKDWSEEWLLVATFATEGDSWWLLYETSDGQHALQPMPYGKIHLHSSFGTRYFDSIARETRQRIMLQVNDNSTRELGLRADLPELVRASQSIMKVNLAEYSRYDSIHDNAVISATESVSETSLCLTTKLNAPEEALEQLISAGLDSSVTIDKENSRLLVQLPCKTGDAAINIFLDKLRYLDDLISCVKLVLGTKRVKIQSLKLPIVVLDYGTIAAGTLSLSISFESSRVQAKLLPARQNPHCLLSDHLAEKLHRDKHSLAENLDVLLKSLRYTLPLLECLQVLQDNTTPSQVPSMNGLDLKESRKWLSMHIMVRSMGRLAVHFMTRNVAFKHDIDTHETPAKMLVRLEIEPNASGFGSKLGFVVRPAIEEFKNYTRPSYASEALKNRLRDRVLRATDPRWLSLDNGAKCLYDKPAPLLIAFHDTILEWLKEAVDEHVQEPVAIKHEDVQPAVPPQQNDQIPIEQIPNAQPRSNPPQAQPNTSQKMQPRPQLTHTQSQQFASMRNNQQAHMRAQQEAMARQAQGGPPQNMPGRSQMPHQNPSMNGNSRVMTAAPQQVRQPFPPNQQRRPNNQQPNRNQGQNKKPNPQDVINLD